MCLTACIDQIMYSTAVTVQLWHSWLTGPLKESSGVNQSIALELFADVKGCLLEREPENLTQHWPNSELAANVNWMGYNNMTLIMTFKALYPIWLMLSCRVAILSILYLIFLFIFIRKSLGDRKLQGYGSIHTDFSLYSRWKLPDMVSGILHWFLPKSVIAWQQSAPIWSCCLRWYWLSDIVLLDCFIRTDMNPMVYICHRAFHMGRPAQIS